MQTEIACHSDEWYVRRIHYQTAKGAGKMFLIEKIAKTDAYILQKSKVIHDGVQRWDATACRVFENRNKKIVDEETGRVSFAHVFFVAPMAKDPELPAKVMVGTREYDIADIKYYHDTRNVNLGYRMIVKSL